MDKPFGSNAFYVCKAGARFGCSVSASAKCKPPWWKSMFGLGSMDLSEREQCEEREMSVCLAAARESCLQLAKEKCLPAFRDARIALSDWDRLGKLQRPTISSTSSPKGAESKSEMLRQLSLDHSSECYPQATNYKGHVLLEGTISLGTSEDESSSGLVSDRTWKCLKLQLDICNCNCITYIVVVGSCLGSRLTQAHLLRLEVHMVHLIEVAQKYKDC